MNALDNAAPQDVSGGANKSRGAESLKRYFSQRYKIHQNRKDISQEHEMSIDFVRQLSDVIFLTDPDGRITHISPSCEKLFGLTQKEMMGQHFMQFIAGQENQGGLSEFREIIQSWEDDENSVLIMKGPEGSKFIGDFIVKVSHTVDGIINGTIGIIRDVTKEKYSGFIENKREQFIESMIKYSPNVIYIHDHMRKKTLYNNERIWSMLGYSKEEILGMGDTILPTLMHPDDFNKYILELSHRTDTLEDKIINHEYRIQHKNGEWRWFNVDEMVVSRNPDGTPREFFGIMQDITKRKEEEVELQNQKLMLSTIFENSPYPMILIDSNGEIIDVNISGTSFSKKPKQQLRGLPIGDAINCIDGIRGYACGESPGCKNCPLKDIMPQIFKGVTLHKKQIRLSIMTNKRPKEYTFLLSTNEIKSIGNNLLLITLIDITDRKAMEQGLHDALAFNRAILNYSPIGIFVYNTNGRGLLANPAAETLIRDICGDNNFQDFQEPDFFEKSGLLECINDSLKTEKLKTCQLHLTKHNSEGIYLDVHCLPFYTKNEKKVLIMVGDVTEQKEMEEKILEAQKLDSIGTLTGGIAHDFNNTLTGVIGFLEIMLMNIEDGQISPEKFKKYIDNVFQSVHHQSEQIKKLLAFGQKGKFRNESIDINMCITENLEFLRHAISPMILIETDLQENIGAIDGDPQQINHAFMNLYVNAVEKMQEGGILRIKSELHDINSFDAKKTGITSGEYIVIKLSDTGGGIDGALQNHIFEPFFTTKKGGKGYGLGLSAAYGIIHSHKGIINVKNIETGTEKGAEFTILFPRGEKVTKKIETASGVMQEGSGTVLVVDDDDVLRELVSEVLDQLGYQHFSAIDGQEGVDIYREFNHEIDLVLLDMQMPRMGGKEAFKLMKSINENVIAILCSGFGKNDEAQEILDLGAKGFLEKPFTIGQLSQLIKSTITVKK